MGKNVDNHVWKTWVESIGGITFRFVTIMPGDFISEQHILQLRAAADIVHDQGPHAVCRSLIGNANPVR